VEKDNSQVRRLFFGLELPDGARRLIASKAARSGRRLRLTTARNLHVTLRFLGDVSDDERERFSKPLREARIRSFTLPIEGVGRFPPRGACKVVWAGVGKGHPALFQLRQTIDDTLLQCGVPCEMREFIPHITMVRVERGGEGAARRLMKDFDGFEGPVFSVDSFCLFQSILEPTGARYEVVERFPLE